jgi:hypothetical protein
MVGWKARLDSLERLPHTKNKAPEWKLQPDPLPEGPLPERYLRPGGGWFIFPVKLVYTLGCLKKSAT